VSLIGFISEVDHLQVIRRPRSIIEKRIANDLLKNAAALQLTTQGRGVYKARAKQSQRQDEVNTFTPVSYKH
jgi:hypothetical protein